MALLVNTLEIKAFRGLEDVTFHGLGRVNLFLGGTNSGKTSVLESISLVEDPLSPLSWVRTANRREPSPFASLTSSRVDRLRYLFPLNEGKPQEVSIAFGGDTPIRSLRASFEEVSAQRRIASLDRETREVVETDEERVGLNVAVAVEYSQTSFLDSSHSEKWEIWEDEPISVRRRTSQGPERTRVRTISPYEHWLRPHQTKEFSEGVFEGSESKILDLLKKVDANIDEVRVLTLQKEPALYFKYKGAGLLPVSAFGDGIRRVLTLALAVPRASKGILLIDEIEIGLHVSMLSRVYSWLVEACHTYDVQLFVTTHSLEAVDALLEADQTAEEDTIGYQLRRLSNETKVKRFGEGDLRRLREERGLDLR
jgi:AAA domain, putative AbiEii toxin, Type IV TA system